MIDGRDISRSSTRLSLLSTNIIPRPLAQNLRAGEEISESVRLETASVTLAAEARLRKRRPHHSIPHSGRLVLRLWNSWWSRSRAR